jgi:DNA-binding SARP family transcriptional activator
MGFNGAVRDGTQAGGGAVQLRLLDGFELRCGGQVVSVPMSAQRLLVFLALHPRPVGRSHVAGALWLEATEEQATASLRSALWRLRRLGHPLVEATASRLQLADGLQVDYREAAARARGLLRDPHPAERDMDRTGLGCDLLPDWWDDWVLLERERFRQLRLHALEALCSRLTAAGRFAEAVQAGLDAVASEPLRETAHRLLIRAHLIRAHLVEGNRAEALRQYRSYARLLRDELGLDPPAEVHALVANLQRIPAQDERAGRQRVDAAAPTVGLPVHAR